MILSIICHYMLMTCWSLWRSHYNLYLNYCPFVSNSALSGFKINWTKSTLLPLCDSAKRLQFSSGNPVVQDFKYLGNHIFSSLKRIVTQLHTNTKQSQSRLGQVDQSSQLSQSPFLYSQNEHLAQEKFYQFNDSSLYSC